MKLIKQVNKNNHINRNFTALSTASISILLAACATTPDYSKLSAQETSQKMGRVRVDNLIIQKNKESPYEMVVKELKPITEKCNTQGGALFVAEAAQFKFDVSNTLNENSRFKSLPVRFECQLSNVSSIWGIRVAYFRTMIIADPQYETVRISFEPNYLSSENILTLQSQRKNQEDYEQKIKNNIQENNRRAATEELAKKQELERTKPMRIEKFQTNLKAGDKTQWKIPSNSCTAVGMVVRIEGNMTFVQFDNYSVSGQSTRYIDRKELEPREIVDPGCSFHGR